MAIRVDEPRMFALFAEFTHYRNILLVPMVRSGPSGSVVHSGDLEPSLPEIRGVETSFTISAFIRAHACVRACMPTCASIDRVERVGRGAPPG
jgi:hypothetical protein